MSDLISRDKALMNARPEYLNPNQEKLTSYNQGWNNAIEMYCRQIAELPTAEPKVGKWKVKSFHECFCDNCGFSFDIMKCDFLENMKHCPNCGAKMEGASDE